MDRISVVIALVLLGALPAALEGCASPCPPRDGSIDGYCEGATALNCRRTCGDCTDQWVEEVCADGCRVVESLPSGRSPRGHAPIKTAPRKFAVCAEWTREAILP